MLVHSFVWGPFHYVFLSSLGALFFSGSSDSDVWFDSMALWCLLFFCVGHGSCWCFFPLGSLSRGHVRGKTFEEEGAIPT